MADFAPPAGPPPPKAPEVPPGWTARWNDQYKEWFYVNLHTKQSQWEKPTEPALPPPPPPPPEDHPGGPPPGYAARPGDPSPIDAKPNPYENHSATPQPPPGPGGPGGPSNAMSEDERLARQLQAEEDQRSRNSPMPPGYALQQQQHQQSQSPFPGQLPPRTQERGKSGGGFLGKLLGKNKMGGGSPQPQYGGYPQQQPQYGGYPPQQGYGGYPPQQGYYPPQQPGYGSYGGYPPMQGGYGGGGYGGYPPQQQQAAGKRPGGGGMGMAGGLALGAGAGLLGGALLANHVDHEEHEAYEQGYNDGANNDDYGGGDDFGGDDFGGDF